MSRIRDCFPTTRGAAQSAFGQLGAGGGIGAEYASGAPGSGVYPISSFTWMLFYQNPSDKTQSKAMVDFMKWALTSGQKFAGEMGYAPLPQNVVDMEMKTLATIKVQ